MSEKIAKIQESLQIIDNIEFKPSGIFANSLLKTRDTTQIIRDIRDEEVTFFQNKKIQDIDYELINNFNFNNDDEFAKFEILKLLNDEINLDVELNDNINRLLPNDLLNDNEYSNDLNLLIKIYKRCYIISKLWASKNINMLDTETNQILISIQQKMNTLIEIFNEISTLNKELKHKREQLDISFDNNEDVEDS